MKKTPAYYTIQVLLVLVVLGLTGCMGNASNESNDSREPEVSTEVAPLEMLRTVEFLDKRDFSDEMAGVESCLEKYDISCAGKHLRDAESFATDEKDAQQLVMAQTGIDGGNLLVKARNCINSESFSCAKNNIDRAKGYTAHPIVAALLIDVENRYQKVHAEYTAREEWEREGREIDRLLAQEKEQHNINFMDSVRFRTNCIDSFCPSSRQCADLCGLAAASWKDNDERRALDYLCEIVAPGDSYGCPRQRSLQAIINQYRLTRP